MKNKVQPYSTDVMSSSSSSGPIPGEWSELHDDVLGTIIHHLNNLIYFIHFGVVCRSWRSSSLNHRLNFSHKLSQIPWILLHTSTQYDDILRSPLHLYDFASQKSYHVHIPHFNNHEFSTVGSSNGFIIYKEGASKLHVINPLTGTHFSFPELHPDSCTVHRAIAIKHRSLNTIMVAIICGVLKCIAVATPNDSSWVYIDCPLNNLDGFHDIIFHKGLLYAVSLHGATLAFDLFDGRHIVLQYQSVQRIIVKRHLVESPNGDDLFLLLSMPTCRKVMIHRVRRLDHVNEEGEWKGMVSNSFGNPALFVGRMCLFFLSASQSSVVVARDCVRSLECSDYDTSDHDLTVFNVIDQKIKKLILPDNLQEMTPVLLLIPSLD